VFFLNNGTSISLQPRKRLFNLLGKAAIPTTSSVIPSERRTFIAAVSSKPATKAAQIQVLTLLVVPLPRTTTGCWVGILFRRFRWAPAPREGRNSILATQPK
jgi:hypothetical protein